MGEKSIQDKGATIFLYLIVGHFIIFQLLSILRAAAIFNTAHLAILLNLFISLIMIFMFLVKIKNIKFNFFETILLLIPIIYFLFGLVVNGFNRDLLTDTYNAAFFAILLTYIRNQNVNFDYKLQIKFANAMLVALLLSAILYWLAPLVGIRVYSIGATSIFFVFPLIVFLINKKNTKFLITLALLIMASKRGVLLGTLSIFLVMVFGSRNIKPIVRTAIFLTLTIIVAGILYITSSPDNVSKTPEQMQPLLYKTMYVNPFSDYNRLAEDTRIREVRDSLQPLIDEPGLLLTGKGPGYTYEHFDSNGNLVSENRHNTHFTLTSVFTKYGIFYTVFLYSFITLVIVKNYNLLKRRELSNNHIILFFYIIAGLVNSITAYTIYLDYLFIVALGILSKNIYSKSSNDLL